MILMKEAAKKLFLTYGGDHGLMHHDGVFEEYQQFGIKEDEEKIWATELIDHLLKDFERQRLADGNFYKLISLASKFRHFLAMKRIIDEVLKQQGQFDTFTKLLVCESILDAFRHYPKTSSENLADSVSIDIKRLLTGLINPPYPVASYYYQHGLMLPDSLSEDSIKARIASVIEEMNVQARV